MKIGGILRSRHTSPNLYFYEMEVMTLTLAGNPEIIHLSSAASSSTSKEFEYSKFFSIRTWSEGGKKTLVEMQTKN